MPENRVDTLEKYGAEFQAKVLSALIEDLPFVQQTFDIILPEFFESDANKWIIQFILDYYSKYKKLPTASVFKVEVDKISSDVMKVAVQAQLRTVGRHLSDDDLDYVKDKFLEFCKRQRLKNAILESVNLLEQERWDEIKPIIDSAVAAGAPKDFGHDWKQDIDKRLKQEVRHTVATPWEPINNIMDGGLAPGELGVIAAPVGAGKSWLLAALGANAMKRGKKIVHFSLELNDSYTGLRYDTIFTGIEPSELKNHYDKVKRIIDSVQGEIVIKYFPSQTVGCNKLLAHIRQMEVVGFCPDLIVVDYGDLLRSNRKVEARYRELDSIYTELRSLAGELAVPVWTASQTQRSSISEEVIQADKIAESLNKIMVADFVLSLSRTMMDKTNGTARIHIIKNRFGPDGHTYPAKLVAPKGEIEVYEENSPQGQKLRDAMKNDSIVRKMLYQKYKDSKDEKDLG